MSKGNRTRRRQAGLLPEPVRCKAHKRNGDPCKKYAVNGAAVCEKHGGNAPQVRRKAEERLASHADVLMKELLRIATSAENEATRLAAVRDALDRIGIGTKKELEVTLPDWQIAIEGILVGEDDDEILDAEVVSDQPSRELTAKYESDERLPSLLYDPPSHQRPGPRLR